MAQNYIVSARKYRPASFRDVVGQQALTHTLKTAIDSQRLAHAYLFCGPRGVGKTSCARIFAKTINCTNLTPEGEACGECESCRAFMENRSYNIVELDAASNNSVDDIRNITDQVRIPPQVGRYRVFIIDEVHMLSTAAFNAFLKTLEEPPEYAIFILATTEKQKVIPTILSRCQIYDFSRITVNDIVQQLDRICKAEGITAEPAALNVIAQKADGAMRDALSIFDQVSASSQGNITYQSAIDNLNVLDYDYYFRLDEAFLAGDVPQTLLIYKEIRDHGFDSLFFINGLAAHLRDLMVAHTPSTVSLLEMNEEVAQQFIAQAQKMPLGMLYRAIDLCNTCDLNYRNSSSKQLLVELTLIKICQLLNPTPQPTAPQGPQGGMRKIQPTATTAAAAQQAHQAQPTAQAQQQHTTAQAQPAAAPAPAQPAASAPAAPTADDGATPPPPEIPEGESAPIDRLLLTEIPKIDIRAIAEAQKLPTLQPSINITDLGQQHDEAAASEAAAAAETHESPFTPDQLYVAWQQYIKEHPGDVIITRTMETSMPQRINDTSYELKVDNAGQVAIFNNDKMKLLTYLRKKVNNDNLMIEVSVREGRVVPKILTDRELAKDINNRHPEFAEFVKHFDLTLY